MASSSSMKNEEPMVFEAERPRFLKIILDDTIHEDKLGIPRKFVRKYGHHLSSRVTLKVSSSAAKWQADIVRSGGEMWIQNGWQEFAAYYLVAHSYFLVFEYEKDNGDFNVIIFDTTATEIDYPSSFSHELNIVHEAEDDDVLIEIADHFSPSRKPKSPISLPPWPTGNRKQSTEKEIRRREQKLSFSYPAKTFSSANPCFQARISFDGLKRHRLQIPRSFVKNMEQGTKATLLEVNNRLWPVNMLIYKHHFRSMLSAGWNTFARDNSLKPGDICNFEMINNSGNTVLMKVSITRTSGICLASERDKKMEESRLPRTATGVDYPLNFSADPNIVHETEDDYGSVEILDHLPSGQEKVNSPTSLHPSANKISPEIFAKIFDPHCAAGTRKQSIEKGSISNEQNLLFSNPPEETKEHTSANPSFKANMTPDCFKRDRLNLPKIFAENIEPGKKATMLKVDNRLWPVKLVIYPGCLRGQIYSGFDAFLWDNSLKVGDVCTFEMTDSSDQTLLIKVSINRDSDICLVNNQDRQEALSQAPRTGIPGEISRKIKEKSPLLSSLPRKEKVENFANKIGKDIYTEVKQENEILPDQNQMANGIVTGEPSFSNPLEETKELTFSNPSFQAKIRPDCFKRKRLCVSKSFAKNMELGPKATNLEMNNRVWPMKLTIYPGFVGVLSLGFDAFARDNSLKVGDVCTFEMIDNSDQTLLIKVSIRRYSDVNCGSNQDKEKAESSVPTGEISRKRKEQSPLSSSWPHKEKVDNFTNKTGKDIYTEVKQENETLPDQNQLALVKQENEILPDQNQMAYGIVTREPLFSNSYIPIEDAKMFASVNPFFEQQAIWKATECMYAQLYEEVGTKNTAG